MSAVRERRTAPTNGAARLALVLCVASALSMAVEASHHLRGQLRRHRVPHRLLQPDRPSLRFPPVLLQLACQGVQLLGGDECWHDVHGEGGQEFVEQRHDVRRPLRGVQRWRRMQRVGVLRGHEWLLPVQTRTMLLGGQRRQLVSQRAVSQQRWQRMHLQRLQHHVRRPHGIVCRGHRLRQCNGGSTWTAATCQDCPANSKGAGGTATTCTCADGYYATKSGGNVNTCTACPTGSSKTGSTIFGDSAEETTSVCVANCASRTVLGRRLVRGLPGQLCRRRRDRDDVHVRRELLGQEVRQHLDVRAMLRSAEPRTRPRRFPVPAPARFTNDVVQTRNVRREPVPVGR